MPHRVRCSSALLALLLSLAGPSAAQTVVEPGEQAVIDANRAIRENNAKIAAENAAAQAAYRQEVARVEAQRRANEADYAAKTAAFEAKQAQYEADVARWQAESARVAAQNRAPVGRPPREGAAPGRAAADKLICRQVSVTGSNIPREKICRTQAEWSR